jgi:hypothetical protein
MRNTRAVDQRGLAAPRRAGSVEPVAKLGQTALPNQCFALAETAKPQGAMAVPAMNPHQPNQQPLRSGFNVAAANHSPASQQLPANQVAVGDRRPTG